ncbi:MAG: exodeoxyribonuclease VII small subunit [Gammaproteobacteria bacterium]|nr:exodeoxyribonuclease VII small subunit [Gammaproteobacteria bacterium]
MARKTTTKAIDFEKSLKQLETLVDKLEKGDLSLEDSLMNFEQGVKLTRECQDALQTAEQKISVLSKEDKVWVEKDLVDDEATDD